MTSYPKQLCRVSPDVDIDALQQAIAEGRVYWSPPPEDDELTRAEVMKLTARVRCKATDAILADRIWNALLTDSRLLQRMRIRQRGRTGEINGYVIAALLTTMLELGIYSSTMKQLCTLAFGASDADRYRRHCNAYITFEDEKKIKTIINF